MRIDRTRCLVEHALTGDSHATGDVGPGHVDPGLVERTHRTRSWRSTPTSSTSCVRTCSAEPRERLDPRRSRPTDKPYGSQIPGRSPCVIRSSVEIAFADALGIDTWHAVVGGSMGGMRALEWAVRSPRARRSTHRVRGRGRVDGRADRTQPAADSRDQGRSQFSRRGLLRRCAAHRRVSRSLEDSDRSRIARPTSSRPVSLAPPKATRSVLAGGQYAIESYLEYHGEKLARRFDANSYIVLSEAMNHHDVGRGRGGVGAALGTIRSQTTVLGIDSDRLYPLRLQDQLAEHIEGASHVHVISSGVGHDGFLLEVDQIGKIDRGVTERLDAATLPSTHVTLTRIVINLPARRASARCRFLPMRRPLALALVLGVGSALVMASGSFADSRPPRRTTTTSAPRPTTTKSHGLRGAADRSSLPEAALEGSFGAHHQDRQHARSNAAVRRKRSRRRLRGDRRGRDHAPGGDLQLRGSRRSSVRCGPCGAPIARSSFRSAGSSPSLEVRSMRSAVSRLRPSSSTTSPTAERRCFATRAASGPAQPLRQCAAADGEGRQASPAASAVHVPLVGREVSRAEGEVVCRQFRRRLRGVLRVGHDDQVLGSLALRGAGRDRQRRSRFAKQRDRDDRQLRGRRGGHRLVRAADRIGPRGGVQRRSSRARDLVAPESAPPRDLQEPCRERSSI